MSVRWFVIIVFLILPGFGLSGQTDQVVKLSSSQSEIKVLPGQIVNLAFFAENKTDAFQSVEMVMNLPDGWKRILSSQKTELKPGEKKFLIFSVQIPSLQPVGEVEASLLATNVHSGGMLDSLSVFLTVGEVEKIEMYLVKSPEFIRAGEELRSEFLLQNLGNTVKKVFFETRNCRIDGKPEIDIEPGQSVRLFAVNQPSGEIIESSKSYFTVRALVSGEVKESIFQSYLVFPVKEKKKDLYFRFPVEFSATYLSSNQRGSFQQGWQFELSGSGSLDESGKHQLDFLARGPNNINLSFLGMYDQYFVSYTSKNLELFAGEKAFSFTPLTESSRFGIGAESKIIFNNGLNFGAQYVKPRFYQEIKDEMAVFAGADFNDKNSVALYFISKQWTAGPDVTQLASLNTRFQPLERTLVELEFSRGYFQETRDNAVRANFNSQFSIFTVAGNYYYTGKNYPGYFSNSTFYSGNLSANLSQKISLGFYAKEDFINARLDTFFVTAPYSRSLQSVLNYKLASRAYLKFFWRQYERKDRLVLDKFHYKTNSINSQFSYRLNRFEYSVLGEYGETTNFLLEPGKNQQNMYRSSLNLAYRFNSKHALRLFGSWSNINRFISGEQKNLMAGMSVVSEIAKNLRANIHLQNAYNIEDYYRNRNLMQMNIDFTPGTKHKFSLRSFYTLFRQETENPELTFSVNYSYKLGVPLKKVILAGDLKGCVTRENGVPVDGLVISFMNKTAVTNRNGEFSFKAVPTGRHLLFVDKSALAINEIPEIADHFQVEILEDKVSEANFKITKGAKFSGKFEVEETGITVLQKGEVKLENIIIELKNDQEQYRITTSDNGNFSFPLVRPGEWSFRIYTTSLPEGYEVEEPVTRIQLQPGDNKNLAVLLKQKKRNIIFKSENKVLQPLKQLNSTDEKPGLEQKEIAEPEEPKTTSFYSVQIGAFKRKIAKDADYFKAAPYDFEKQKDNLYKYFIGRFSSETEAASEQKRLEKIYINPFVVRFKDEQIIQFEND